MSSATTSDVATELQVLRTEIDHGFQNGEWERLASSLDILAQMGERQGERELCLRSQCLKELIGERAGGRGKRMDELFNDLMFYLTHMEWVHQGTPEKKLF